MARASDGQNVWRCKIPEGLLNGGTFYVSPRLSIHNIAWLVHEEAVIQFEVRLREVSRHYGIR